MKEFKCKPCYEHEFLWWGKELYHRKRTNRKMLIYLNNLSHLQCLVNVIKNITQNRFLVT